MSHRSHHFSDHRLSPEREDLHALILGLRLASWELDTLETDPPDEVVIALSSKLLIFLLKPTSSIWTKGSQIWDSLPDRELWKDVVRLHKRVQQRSALSYTESSWHQDEIALQRCIREAYSIRHTLLGR